MKKNIINRVISLTLILAMTMVMIAIPSESAYAVDIPDPYSFDQAEWDAIYEELAIVLDKDISLISAEMLKDDLFDWLEDKFAGFLDSFTPELSIYVNDLGLDGILELIGASDIGILGKLVKVKQNVTDVATLINRIDTLITGFISLSGTMSAIDIVTSFVVTIQQLCYLAADIIHFFNPGWGYVTVLAADIVSVLLNATVSVSTAMIERNNYIRYGLWKTMIINGVDWTDTYNGLSDQLYPSYNDAADTLSAQFTIELNNYDIIALYTLLFKNRLQDLGIYAMWTNAYNDYFSRCSQVQASKEYWHNIVMHEALQLIEAGPTSNFSYSLQPHGDKIHLVFQSINLNYLYSANLNSQTYKEIRDILKGKGNSASIASMSALIAKLNAAKRTTSCPLAIDLDGTGIETISLENGVYFDVSAK